LPEYLSKAKEKCTTRKRDFPEAGPNMATCFLDLGGLDDRYAGGSAHQQYSSIEKRYRRQIRLAGLRPSVNRHCAFVEETIVYCS
jgi:hypothetical protein